jgi:outer membrane protein insertion porin family/translocation and assembly module TamA
LQQRWWHSPRNTIAASLFSHRRSSPGIYVDRGYGAAATFTRELADRTPLSSNYRFEITRVEAGDVYFCVNFGICDAPTINALSGNQKLSPLSISFFNDRTDLPFSPTKGRLLRIEAEHASQLTASDFRYNRVFGEASAYRPFGTRYVLAGRVRGGWVAALKSTARATVGRALEDSIGSRDILHPRKRFYAGGSQSVRGFGENQLGPRVLTIGAKELARAGCDTSSVTTLRNCNLAFRGDTLRDSDFVPRPLGGTTLVEASVELRVKVWKQFTGAVFLDGAILGEGTLRDASKGTAAITPGFGGRYRSPVGPIRVDLGLNPRLFGAGLRERLQVISEAADSTGQHRLVQLGTRVYPQQRSTGLRRITDNVVLHLSIGEAF